MDMVSVSSSNISEVGYDEEEEILGILFNSGILYHYKGVSKEAFEALRDAPSVGKHFNAEIRDNYVTEKIG